MNQMKKHGGLGHTLRTALQALPVGHSLRFENCSFTRADLRECIDDEIDGKIFSISDVEIEGGTTYLLIVRSA